MGQGQNLLNPSLYVAGLPDTNKGEQIRFLGNAATPKSKIVYISGLSNSRPVVTRADLNANGANRGPFFVTVTACLAANTPIDCAEHSLVSLDTSAAAVNDPVYLSATAGDFTLTKPTGPEQPIVVGIVLSVGTTGYVWLAPNHFSRWIPKVSTGQRTNVIRHALLLDAGVGDYSFVLPVDVAGASYKVVAFSTLCEAADAGATARLYKGANAVSDALTMATNKEVDYAATIDSQYSIYAPGDTVKVTVAGGSAAARGVAIIDFMLV